MFWRVQCHALSLINLNQTRGQDLRTTICFQLFVSRLCLVTERFSTEYQRLLIQPIKKDADNQTLLFRPIKKDADDQTSQSEQAELLSVTGNIF